MRLGDQLPMLMIIELYFYRNPYLDLLLMKPLPLVLYIVEGARCYICFWRIYLLKHTL